MSQSPSFLQGTSQSAPAEQKLISFVEPDQNVSGSFLLSQIGSPSFIPGNPLPDNVKSTPSAISAPGEYMEFTMQQGAGFTIGLTPQAAAQSGLISGDYSFIFFGTISGIADGIGASISIGPNAPGDVFRFEINQSGIMEFYLNGTLLLTDTAPVTGPLYPFLMASFFTGQGVAIISDWKVCRRGALEELMKPRVITQERVSHLTFDAIPFSNTSPTVTADYLSFIKNELQLSVIGTNFAGIEGDAKFDFRLVFFNSVVGPFRMEIETFKNGTLVRSYEEAFFGAASQPFVYVNFSIVVENVIPSDQFSIVISIPTGLAVPPLLSASGDLQASNIRITQQKPVQIAVPSAAL